MSRLIDAHCHLLELDDAGRGLLGTAGTPQVMKFFSNSAGEKDWDTLRKIAAEHRAVFPFFGIHPWFARAVQEGWERRLREFLHGACGVGEIGLDWMHKESGFAQQRVIFFRQVEIALELGKPFCVHCVGAWEELFAVLSEARCRRPFIAHGFSGTLQAMERLLGMGGYISFRALDPENRRTKTLIEALPAQRLLLETDFPYLPGAIKGQPDTGLYCRRLENLYETAAELKGLTRAELELIVEKNGSVFSD